jgi:Tfp pilus assembly protein PilF
MQDEIKRLFEGYLASKPREPAPYAHYGTMLYVTANGDGPDRYRDAKRYLSEALIRDPKYAPAHFQLGVIAQAEGRMTDAARAFERAIAASPSYATAHYRLANVYQRLGESDRAAAELKMFQQSKVEEAERERATLLRSLSATH